MKRLFLSADMEGTTGIACWDETEWGNSRSLYFREQMTREVSAACEGALAAGYEEIWVKDAHDSGRNLLPDRLPEQTLLLREWIGDGLSMMGGINRSRFDAAAFTGYHSWAGGEGNPLSHTMHTTIHSIRINDIPASEFLLNSYTAGYHGVPVCFLSGDKALCDFARGWIGGITTVAVNEGWGSAVLSIHPALAVRRIRAGMEQALNGDLASCRVPMPAHFTVEIEFKSHANALSRLVYPGVEKLSGTAIRFQSDDWMQVVSALNYIL